MQSLVVGIEMELKMVRLSLIGEISDIAKKKYFIIRYFNFLLCQRVFLICIKIVSVGNIKALSKKHDQVQIQKEKIVAPKIEGYICQNAGVGFYVCLENMLPG